MSLETTITMKVSTEMSTALDRIAARERRSKAFVIREMIEGSREYREEVK